MPSERRKVTRSVTHRRRIAKGVALTAARRNRNPVALAIVKSAWATITAYAVRIGKSQGALSRYMAGGLSCPPEVHAAVIRDFPRLRRTAVSRLWPAGVLDDDATTP